MAGDLLAVSSRLEFSCKENGLPFLPSLVLGLLGMLPLLNTPMLSATCLAASLDAVTFPAHQPRSSTSVSSVGPGRL